MNFAAHANDAVGLGAVGSVSENSVKNVPSCFYRGIGGTTLTNGKGLVSEFATPFASLMEVPNRPQPVKQLIASLTYFVSCGMMGNNTAPLFSQGAFR